MRRSSPLKRLSVVATVAGAALVAMCSTAKLAASDAMPTWTGAAAKMCFESRADLHITNSSGRALFVRVTPQKIPEGTSSTSVSLQIEAGASTTERVSSGPLWIDVFRDEASLTPFARGPIDASCGGTSYADLSAHFLEMNAIVFPAGFGNASFNYP